MEKLSPNVQKVSDFIYQKPEVVAMLLNQHGYNINIDKATLPQINTLTFDALYSGNMEFAQSFDQALANDGYLGIVATLAISVGTSIVSGIMAGNEAARARELQKNIALSQMALDEKLSAEKLKSLSETEGAKILLNTALAYRQTLQTESTARLKDTWIYVVGLGLGISFLYGIYLISKK
jgi:hypothetical protein